MRILDLYAGLGGNRKNWHDVEVTAVELNPKIAKVYQRLFPNDKVIIGDAHQYLIENFNDYDFIWASPPCPTHSDIRRCGVHRGIFKPVYPDMSLYQEIILLQNFAKCKWVVENVIPYYKPLIPPKAIINRHYFWSNFYIRDAKFDNGVVIDKLNGTDEVFGFCIKDTDIENKRKTLRNLVMPEVGEYILNTAMKTFTSYEEGLFANL